MDRVLLETFKAVVDEGGALKAANVLGCAQSNVTTRLKQMEQRLGVPLFNRQGKRLQLSEAGERYLPYVTRILDLINEAAANARAEAPAVQRLAWAPWKAQLPCICRKRWPACARLSPNWSCSWRWKPNQRCRRCCCSTGWTSP